MPVDNLLPPLAETPRDARDRAEEVGSADEIVYRLAFKAIAVPGLPDTTTIDDVTVEFVHGPVRAQQTELRQRHQLPVVFDKVMRRNDVGAGQLIALFSLRRAPVPEDLETAFLGWRGRVLAAAGLLASVLDERIAGEELFEDAVLLDGGAFVGAVDMRGSVRTYLPFDVTTADRAAIDQLRHASLSEHSNVARAARLYRRAALEGPTADAYAMLWVAAECFSKHRSPSKKEIEAALDESGLNPSGLPISVGRLIDLRGRIQHHGLDSDDRLRMAFYEMEAIVRALIRRETKLPGGWWPASDNPAGFADPFDDAVARLMGPGESVWHREAIPPPETPEPHRLPRRTPNAHLDPRLKIDNAFGDVRHLLANVVVDALEWQDPNASLAVHLGLPSGGPEGAGTMASASGIWLSKGRIDDLDQPETLVNFVWDVHSLVGAALAQRSGINSDGGAGSAVVEAFGAWAQYRRLVIFGEFDPTLLNVPSGRDPIALGKIAGWAAAGDPAAAAAAESLDGEARQLVEELVRAFRDHRPGAPTHVLELAGLVEPEGAQSQ